MITHILSRLVDDLIDRAVAIGSYEDDLSLGVYLADLNGGFKPVPARHAHVQKYYSVWRAVRNSFLNLFQSFHPVRGFVHRKYGDARCTRQQQRFCIAK